MAKIAIIEDRVEKDEFGNGNFVLKMSKKKFIGKTDYYVFNVYRDEENLVSGCKLEKIMLDGEKSYTFDLRFDGKDNSKNFVKYRKRDIGYDQTFDIFKTDVMFSSKLRKEEIKILNEFDKVMWIDSKHSQSKATLIDVFTDIIDTTQRDDVEIDGVKVSDIDVIHVATKGFFSEVTTNVEHVNF